MSRKVDAFGGLWNCKKAATQLNVLKRFKKNFTGFKEKKILVQSFVYSNFNYCPFVWYFSSAKSLQKIEQLQERALRFLYNDHTSSYNDLLLKSDKGTMLVARQRTLCIEIFKTVKHLKRHNRIFFVYENYDENSPA